MDLSNLTPAEGSVKNRKRIARGQGSGKGGTATRGMNGQKSRAGYSKKVGFEGGQMPLQRRVPKFGFKNFTRVEYSPINLERIQYLVEKYDLKVVDFETLYKYSIVQKNDLVKVLGRGELTASVEVHAHAFSEKAIAAIEEKGGKVVKL